MPGSAGGETEHTSVMDATTWSARMPQRMCHWIWPPRVTGTLAQLLPETRIRSFPCQCSPVRWRSEVGRRPSFPLKERNIEWFLERKVGSSEDASSSWRLIRVCAIDKRVERGRKKRCTEKEPFAGTVWAS